MLKGQSLQSGQSSWIEIQKAYNKDETTGYTQEHEGQIRLHQENVSKKIVGQPRLACTRMIGREKYSEWSVEAWQWRSIVFIAY